MDQLSRLQVSGACKALDNPVYCVVAALLKGGKKLGIQFLFQNSDILNNFGQKYVG